MVRWSPIAAAALAGVLLAAPQPPSLAHDWYPRECCSNVDCAPADTIERRADG
ncbi:MAG: hypothetical protein HY060_21535, partial [Proteobacteria bacterium]|nr:hypothetical protein [Pseudomonadota bacterium]